MQQTRRARRRTDAKPAGASLGGRSPAPARRNPMAARAVIVGVVFYCLIAWAAVFKIVSVGWEALKPNPVHYAQQNNERTE